MKTVSWICALSLLVIILTGCATEEAHEQATAVDMGMTAPPGDYSKVIDQWTESKKAYAGFTQTFQATATLLSNDVIEHQIFKDAAQFHWSQDQFRTEREKALNEAQNTTTFFVSLYTASDENNNLDKSKSDWNVFLDVNGKHISPSSVKRLYENRAGLALKYSYVNAWSRFYFIKFPASTSEVQAGKAQLILAGVLGDVHLSYPK